MHDFPLRADEFDGGSGFAFANGTAEKELRPKFLRSGGGVDFDFDGRFSTNKLTEHDAGGGIKITFEHGRGEGIGGQFFGAHHDPSAPGVVFFFSPFLKFVSIVGGDPVKDHSFFEEGVPKLLGGRCMGSSKILNPGMGIVELEHIEVFNRVNLMGMDMSAPNGVIENRYSSGLAGLVHVILQDFGPVVVLEAPGDQSMHVHGGRVNRRGHLFSGHEQEVLPWFAFEFDRRGIDELVVLTENEKVVSAVVIPLGNRIGLGVGMTAQRGVHMGVAFVPLVGPKKNGEQGEEQEVEQSNRHAWKLHELSNPVNGRDGRRRMLTISGKGLQAQETSLVYEALREARKVDKEMKPLIKTKEPSGQAYQPKPNHRPAQKQRTHRSKRETIRTTGLSTEGSSLMRGLR